MRAAAPGRLLVAHGPPARWPRAGRSQVIGMHRWTMGSRAHIAVALSVTDRTPERFTSPSSAPASLVASAVRSRGVPVWLRWPSGAPVRYCAHRPAGDAALAGERPGAVRGDERRPRGHAVLSRAARPCRQRRRHRSDGRPVRPAGVRLVPSCDNLVPRSSPGWSFVRFMALVRMRGVLAT